jgi:mono/diheme cytochrome c family protein
MNKLRNLPRAFTIIAFLALIVFAWSNFSGIATGSQHGNNRGDIARGKYLVEEVAKCPECHTPRDAQGNLDTHAWLQGAPIWIMPVRPIQNWADNVPALAGLPSFTDAQMETVLEKGTGPEGEVLRPPMHIYHMTRADAQAIIAYLKSLPPPGR